MKVDPIYSKVKSRGFMANTFLRIIFAGITSISIMSCDQASKQGADEQKTIRLYTSVPIKIVHKIKREYEKQYGNIQLDVRREGTAAIMKRIREEAASGEVNADVIWLADFSNAEDLKQSELLQKYQSPENKYIFSLFKDPQGYYAGSRLLNMVLAYNTNYVKKVPTSYNDLLEPKWRGRVGIVNPETSGSSFYTISSLMLEQQHGQQFFIQLSKNDVQIIDNNSTLTEKIAAGELYMGITIDFAIRNLKSKHPDLPVSYVYPKKGTVVIASPIALAKQSKEPEKSKQFIDWVLSSKGQTLMSEKFGIVPVREDVASPPGMIPLAELLVFSTDPSLINQNREISLEKYRELFHKSQERN